MAGRHRMVGAHGPPQLACGDRARAKTTSRVGTITDVTIDRPGHAQYHLAYDEQPQDAFLSTAGATGTDVPEELIEAE
jgi:hypothetical protein